MSESKDINENISDLVKLVAVLVKRESSQGSLIIELGEVGMSPTKIATLLNTSANVVNVTLSKNKRKKK
ncbi:MAG TPA: hypothetical protein VGO21_05835 [Candidatus Paceibacterota bacterium]|jgi:hypothetical protein|nr:hypothetical protein [Candidatus Paceibacterota bacterium]